MDHRVTDRPGATPSAGQHLLDVRGVSKRYGGVQALREVGFTLSAGEVLALAGHNGAGKSTLIGILAGARRPDAGQIVIDGVLRTFSNPRQAAAAGIGVCYQEPMLVPQLTVAANVFLTRERMSGRVRLDRADIRRRYRDLVESTGIDLPADTPVGHLSVAQRQLVQISRALAGGARIVVLDEPTAALSPSDRLRLFGLIRSLRESDARTSFVIVSHFLEELEDNCDRAIVLRNGTVAASIPRRPSARELARIMAGPDARSLEVAPPLRHVPGEVLLSVNGLRALDADPATLTVRSGEIVGLAGLVGSGRTELLHAIALGRGRRAGDVRIADVPVRTGRRALRHGLALLPEDRRDAIIADWPLWRNVSLPSLKASLAPLALSAKAERQKAAALLERCRVVAASINQKVRTLSGGNQQKVSFAKLLASDFKVALLDEPTHGVDVHAKTEIFAIVDELAAEGRGFLVVSAEFEDLLRMSTRVVTMHKGRLIAEHDVRTGHTRPTADQLLFEAATGRPHADNAEGDPS